MMFVDVDRRYPRRWPTLALILSLSRSLRVTVFFSFHIKTYLPLASIISKIQDSIVFGCSHFIGSLYSSLYPLNYHYTKVTRKRYVRILPLSDFKGLTKF
jgi:hypothetical protein